MPKTLILRTRVDSEKKRAAEAVLAKLGISVGDAINLFLSQVGIQKEIPFPLTTRRNLDLSNATPSEIEKRYAERVPNAKTKAALTEDTGTARRYKSSSQLLKALKA
jgi:addiction module RelB/DinJ family antitoxin